MSEEKKTLREWASENGIEILDPDGFDRTDPNLWERMFTKKEFQEGIWRCTIMWKGGCLR